MSVVYAKSYEDLKNQVTGLVEKSILENGIKLPFQATNFSYSNRKIDNWLRIREGEKLLKYNITTNKVVIDKILAITEGEI